MQVSKTILDQLGGNKFIAMTGAKQLVNLGNGLQFGIGKGAINKANKVVVKFNNNDLYDVEFFSIRGCDIISKGLFPDVYADNLRTLFTQQTGFDTSL